MGRVWRILSWNTCILLELETLKVPLGTGAGGIRWCANAAKNRIFDFKACTNYQKMT